MKVFKILGSRQPVIDLTQAVLVGISSMIGLFAENVFFLVIAPALFFVITFIIKLKYFGGKPEWGIYTLRMINQKRIYYGKQNKDTIRVKR